MRAWKRHYTPTVRIICRGDNGRSKGPASVCVWAYWVGVDVIINGSAFHFASMTTFRKMHSTAHEQK